MGPHEREDEGNGNMLCTTVDDTSQCEDVENELGDQVSPSYVGSAQEGQRQKPEFNLPTAFHESYLEKDLD